MLRLKTSALSMIELMVAILIISILAAVSGPVFRSYNTKSKIAVVLQEMAEYKDKVLATYQETDQLPDKIGNLNAGSYYEPDSEVLDFVYYNGVLATQAAFLYGFTADLGISGYVAPSAPNAAGCSFCRITIAIMPTETGHMQVYCGQADGSDQDVPLTALPASCQDTNILTTIS